MVLESIIIPSKMEKKPVRMFYVGFAYSTVGLFLALLVFGRYASLTSIFLTTMPLVVVMYRAIRVEEWRDKRIKDESRRLREHRHILSFFMFLFIGLVASYSLWFTILPKDIVNNMFSTQMSTIDSITGIKIEAAGYASKNILQLPPIERLGLILKNNIKVLAFCILFSFLYGAGAIFILVWNASIIGVAVGNVIRTVIANYSNQSQMIFLYNYFSAFPVSLSYMIHGTPEILAYFIGALAGGIISVAVVNHDYEGCECKGIILDSVELILISLIVLIIAGLIEVYVTPLFLGVF